MPGYFAGELLSTDWITSWKGVTVLIVASIIAILVTYFINHKNKKAR